MIKIAETRIDKKTLDAIYINWHHHLSEQGNPEILDETNRLRVNLRVPYFAKGEFNHMTISTEMKVLETNECVYLSAHGNILKPLFISIIIGIITYLFFFYTERNVVFTISASVSMSTIYFAYFYAQLRKTCRRFLLALKENSK